MCVGIHPCGITFAAKNCYSEAFLHHAFFILRPFCIKNHIWHQGWTQLQTTNQASRRQPLAGQLHFCRMYILPVCPCLAPFIDTRTHVLCLTSLTFPQSVFYPHNDRVGWWTWSSVWYRHLSISSTVCETETEWWLTCDSRYTFTAGSSEFLRSFVNSKTFSSLV